MPEPNIIRYYGGYTQISACGCVVIEPEALAIFPGLPDALNEAVGAGLRMACGVENPHIQIGLLRAERLPEIGELFQKDLCTGGIREEGYFLNTGLSTVEILADDSRGFAYALQTLAQLIVKRENNLLTIKNCAIFDYPLMKLRGAHIYLPALGQIPFCKRYLRELARLKYNRVYFEVSAMEYKRHPEINEAWVEYARDMNERADKAKVYQGGSHSPERPWYKDSIHIENGGGYFLTQDEVRDIVRYAKSLLLDVVPEIQSLSHCDYLVIAHREIAEHPDDPYPDAYCPSNPASYELLFDVIDEVLDVFQPECASMGHDEWYSVAMCPKCRGKDASELLASDINKIRDYLLSKGVSAEMMADKLLDGHTPDARGQGGAERIIEDYATSEVYGRMPSTYRASDLIARDVLLHHWHWALEPLGNSLFADKGFRSTYHNFGAFGSIPRDWDTCSRQPGVMGCVLTHWDAVDERTMAWDQYLTGTVFCSELMWNERNGEKDLGRARDLAFAYMPECRQALSGRALPSLSAGQAESVGVALRHERKEWFYMDSSCVELRNFVDTRITSAPSGRYWQGVNVESAETAQRFRIAVVGGLADSLVFEHCTDIQLPYRSGDYGWQPEDYRIGRYIVRYANGTAETVDLDYGWNIGSLDAPWGFDTTSSDCYASNDIHLFQTAYAAVPAVRTTNRKPFITVYRHEWINPHPGKEIADITLALENMKKPFSVFVYGIAGIKLG